MHAEIMTVEEGAIAVANTYSTTDKEKVRAAAPIASVVHKLMKGEKVVAQMTYTVQICDWLAKICYWDADEGFALAIYEKSLQLYPEGHFPEDKVLKATVKDDTSDQLDINGKTMVVGAKYINVLRRSLKMLSEEQKQKMQPSMAPELDFEEKTLLNPEQFEEERAKVESKVEVLYNDIVAVDKKLEKPGQNGAQMAHYMLVESMCGLLERSLWVKEEDRNKGVEDLGLKKLIAMLGPHNHEAEVANVIRQFEAIDINIDYLTLMLKDGKEHLTPVEGHKHDTIEALLADAKKEAAEIKSIITQWQIKKPYHKK